jgi:hypothetical protein
MAFSFPKIFGSPEKPKPVFPPEEKLKVEAPKPAERTKIGGAEFPNIPYENYKEVSKQLAQEAAEAERLEEEARRKYDFKAAAMYKQKRTQILEKQRQILREAAALRELKRQGKI